MDVRTRLLVDKVKEAVVGDERLLMLLLVLLTAEGEADMTAPAFQGFRRRFGEPALHQTLAELSARGLVQLGGTWVRLNCPPAPAARWTEAVEACGEAILQQAALRFGRLIGQYRESREGRYFLDVLAGLAEGEEGAESIARALGARQWGELQWQLEFQGLLVPVARPGEAPRLQVFAPFQALVTMLYQVCHWAQVARQVRPDAGVLYQDVTTAWGQGIVDMAVRLDLLSLDRWHDLLVVVPTAQGAEVAGRSLARTAAAAGSALEELVSRYPRAFVRYLLRNLQSDPTLLQDEPDTAAHLCSDHGACLLQDALFREQVHGLLGRLVELNLAVADVHGFVAAGGGELRGRYFVVAPEAIFALGERVPEATRLPAAAPEGGAELMHRLLYVFGAMPYDAGLHLSRLQWLAQERQVPVEALHAALRQLERDGVVQVSEEEADPVVSVRRWPELYRRYHQPFVRALLQPEAPMWDSFAGGGLCH